MICLHIREGGENGARQRSTESPKQPPAVAANAGAIRETLLLGKRFRHYQAELIALALGQNPPAKPPKPEDDKLVPIRVAAERFGLSRRTVGRRIRPQQRPPLPAPLRPQRRSDGKGKGRPACDGTARGE